MDIDKNKNEDTMKLLLSKLNHRLVKIRLGGGTKRIEKHHSKGKLTARERINRLVDEGNEWLEVGAFAGYGMYEEYGGCPSGGVVVALGRVCGRLCVIVANDATVKAGAWFPITGKKNLRAQEISMENRDIFLQSGGQQYQYIPCLNDRKDHISALAGLIQRHLGGWI